MNVSFFVSLSLAFIRYVKYNKLFKRFKKEKLKYLKKNFEQVLLKR